MDDDKTGTTLMERGDHRKDLGRSLPPTERSRTGTAPAAAAVPFDYRRRDRVGKDRLQAVRFVHSSFAKSAAVSLSTYLRTFAVVNLISVEQLPFRDYTYCASDKNSFLKISLEPCNCGAVLEISSTLSLFAVETLLGGVGRRSAPAARELTEIEQSILDGLYRLLAQDLQNAWSQVAPIAVTVEGHESQPRLAQILSPTEPVLAVSFEVQMSSVSGVMNFVFPTLALAQMDKVLGKEAGRISNEVSEEHRSRILNLLQSSLVRVEARLDGATMQTRSLLELSVGKVVSFDHSMQRPIAVALNGKPTFAGSLRAAGHKRSVVLATSDPPQAELPIS